MPTRTSVVSSSRCFLKSLRRKHGFKLPEVLPALAIVAVPLIGQGYYALATQIIVTIIFAISLDLLVGYAGIVTLGHAAFFGVGAYTAGIISVKGWGEPLSGLALAAAASGTLGFVLGAIVLRTTRFTLLMLTLSSIFLLSEIANKATSITGGVDGLVGIETWPLLGFFQFDLFGQTGFFYASGVFLAVWMTVRWLVHAPFGQSVMAIRDNPSRAVAIGIGLRRRQNLIFTISSGLAGLAGGLQAQIIQFVGLKDIGFELSVTTLVMLMIGGAGRLYGAMVGPSVYLVAQDYLAKDSPELWQLWLGAIIVAIAILAPGGILGTVAKLREKSPWRHSN